MLPNFLLDEPNKEIDHRGHIFSRYADAANIYVCTRRSGERVMNDGSKPLDLSR